MPRYLTPKGPIAICGRCGFKMQHRDLTEDRNVPGLWVCEECNDERDPYKLPPPRPDDITIDHPRPDEPLV